jgi:hypothetical protein
MNLTTIPVVQNIQEPWDSFRVNLTGVGTIQLRDVYPFLSITDMKRLLWIHQKGDPRWAPEHVFVGVRSATEPQRLRPIEFYWPLSVSATQVPDPQTTHVPNPALIDDAGNRKPIGPTMVGSLLLETALSPEIIQSNGFIPVVEAIPLFSLRKDFTIETLTPALFHGYFQFYFPWLTSHGQVLDSAGTAMTTDQKNAYAAIIPYMEDRLGRIDIVQRALSKNYAGSSVSMTSVVRLRWILPPPTTKPVSLEKVFYEIPVSERIPFLRFFPMGGKSSPILKLGLSSNGIPFLRDEKILTSYLNHAAPSVQSHVIVARVPLTSSFVEKGTAFTIYMFEDGNSDITLEVPHRGATYIGAAVTDAQRHLQDIVPALGFPSSIQPLLRDIHATFKWIHPQPQEAKPLSSSHIRERVMALTPFFEQVPPVTGETALAVFQWRAVSNYESEQAQFAFITQLVLRGEETEEGFVLQKYIGELGQKFGLSQDQATLVLERWADRRAEAVAPAAGPLAGALAVSKHSTGASIALYGSHPEYSIEVQGVDSYIELQRILSVVGVLLGTPSSDLTIAEPSPVIEAVAATVAMADTIQVEAVTGVPEEVEDTDPFFAEMLATMGYAEDLPLLDESPPPPPKPEEETTDVAVGPPAPLPNLDAVLSSVKESEECRGTLWKPGEPPLTIRADWYMSKLKHIDEKMFGYKLSTGSRFKSYSKTCQRGDNRQPDIMTMAEYARVKRCYEGRVRFVELPPKSREDLPKYSDYNPRKKYEDSYFLTDPETGNPMWSIYGYENKTRPGEFVYLMCSELWCDRDNLPLLISEFEGTQGRGFTKPENTCPFCGGRVILSMDNPSSGESVIRRMPKKSTGKLHTFIGTISDKHPENFHIPCCDTTPRILKHYLEEYSKKRTAAVQPAIEEDDIAEPDELFTLHTEIGETPHIDYRKIFSSMPTQYILGTDKTLGAGKLGLLTPMLDAFFGQDGPHSLTMKGIRPTFMDNVFLFVRTGVDVNPQTPGLNLFAGLAPLLGFESAEQTMKTILSLRIVRAFESANYGTLVHEFAARATVTETELTKSLQEFASTFGYPLGPARPHVIRLYKAWTAFLHYLADPYQPKQIRHLEHLLAQPGIITPRGLLLIVLEQDGDSIRIVCPSFGIPPASLFTDIPISFLWHDKRNEHWEPIVLYNGTKDAVLYFEDRSPDLEYVPQGLRTGIRRWLRDWRSSSVGCGRPAPPPHVWTPDRDTTLLPRLSQMLQKVQGHIPISLVRDRSNRLAGVLFSVSLPGAATSTMFVPCLDDGHLADQRPRLYEVEMIPPVSVDIYLRFYTELAKQYAGLAPKHLLVRISNTSEIVGFATAIGTMIPTAHSALGSVPTDLPTQQVDEFPWERDALILRDPTYTVGATLVHEESTVSVEEQMTEAYQHLRITLSQWLLRDAEGPALRSEISRLYRASIPLYEKRKRMDILLEPYIRRWVITEETEQRKALSLLREDCLQIATETACTAGMCTWSGGRCFIHVPYRKKEEGSGTDPIRIFTARLSDELLRYTEKRNDILEDRIPKIRSPKGIVRVGNELFISSRPKEFTTNIIERLGFTGDIPVSFPEEILRFTGMDDVSVADETKLPEYFGNIGFQLAQPREDIDQAHGLVFASITNRTLEEWEDQIKKKRADMNLPGLHDRPLQWSLQDYYIIATLAKSNLLFLRLSSEGALQIKTWIRPEATSVKILREPLYMLFWGPQKLLLSQGVNYRFMSKGLPHEVITAMDRTSPEEESDLIGHVENGSDEIKIQLVEEEKDKEEAKEEEAKKEEAKKEEAKKEEAKKEEANEVAKRKEPKEVETKGAPNEVTKKEETAGAPTFTAIPLEQPEETEKEIPELELIDIHEGETPALEG